jgi:hypothetical protein
LVQTKNFTQTSKAGKGIIDMSASMILNDASTTALSKQAQRKSNLLDIDEATFRKSFNRQPFFIRHHLAGHDLFALPRLIELAKRLPKEFVEYNAGDIPVSQDPNLTPQNGLSIEETIRRIEECQSWMVLKYVEKDSAYAELLNGCLDEIQKYSEPFAKGMSKREGFIFISSPNSVTPYHMDPEYNFLLQIRGKKTMSIFDGRDRSILSEQELEQYLSGGHRNLTFKDEFQQKARECELNSGAGLHIPVTAPHWVKNGSEVSVSFSITFRAPASERRTIVYTTNAYLRKRGLKPVPYGQSAWRDTAKYFSYRAIRRAKHLLGKDM